MNYAAVVLLWKCSEDTVDDEVPLIKTLEFQMMKTNG